MEELAYTQESNIWTSQNIISDCSFWKEASVLITVTCDS